MNYIATIGDTEVKVTVKEVGVARYLVKGAEKEYLVDAHQVQDSVWSILYGTESFEAGKALVTSPMPGKVVKILVAEGEEVQAAQGVIVVEAMKMENELKSAGAGKVQEIFVKEGEVVESGAKLVLVE
jgi:biotin carboxyl carrier protein